MRNRTFTAPFPTLICYSSQSHDACMSHIATLSSRVFEPRSQHAGCTLHHSLIITWLHHHVHHHGHHHHLVPHAHRDPEHTCMYSRVPCCHALGLGSRGHTPPPWAESVGYHYRDTRTDGSWTWFPLEPAQVVILLHINTSL